MERKVTEHDEQWLAKEEGAKEAVERESGTLWSYVSVYRENVAFRWVLWSSVVSIIGNWLNYIACVRECTIPII